jgi:hypothetical protein
VSRYCSTTKRTSGQQMWTDGRTALHYLARIKVSDFSFYNMDVVDEQAALHSVRERHKKIAGIVLDSKVD